LDFDARNVLYAHVLKDHLAANGFSLCAIGIAGNRGIYVAGLGPMGAPGVSDVLCHQRVQTALPLVDCNCELCMSFPGVDRRPGNCVCDSKGRDRGSQLGLQPPARPAESGYFSCRNILSCRVLFDPRPLEASQGTENRISSPGSCSWNLCDLDRRAADDGTSPRYHQYLFGLF